VTTYITTKSIGTLAREGHKNPSVIDLENGLLNAVGLSNPGYKNFEDEIKKGKRSDLALICYTSGTTGKPKGVMLSHENVIRTSQNSVKSEGFNQTDEVMAYLPMAWIGDFMFSIGQALVAGFTINCPESTATVLLDTKDIGPTYLLCPPRIWENMLTEVMIKIEDADFLKRKLFHFFMDVLLYDSNVTWHLFIKLIR